LADLHYEQAMLAPTSDLEDSKTADLEDSKSVIDKSEALKRAVALYAAASDRRDAEATFSLVLICFCFCLLLCLF
jgi:hypothetical protein